jgi:hypothetical protein
VVERTPILTDVAKLAEEAGNGGVSGSTGSSADRRHSDLGDARRARQRARRVEALSLKLAGGSTAQIAERMGIQPDTVRKLLNRTPATAENRAAEEMRELENGPGWTGPRPPSGDRSWPGTTGQWWSSCRSASNGPTERSRLPAPVVLSSNVREEMERALADLQQVVLAGEIEPLADHRPDLMISSTWPREPSTHRRAFHRRALQD